MCGSPVLRFLVFGVALFAAARIWEPARAPARLTVTPQRTQAAAMTDDDVLLRAALARGIDRDSRQVRARLVALGRYLGLAAADDEIALEREARLLGLQWSDPIVRRHLVEMMRLAAGKLDPSALPSEADLRAYYARVAARYAEPARVRLAHVYFSRDRRGETLDRDAAALLDTLRTRALDPAAAAATGDPFARGAQLSRVSAEQLDRIFGPGFGDAVFALPPRTWSGPIPSSYGLHLVWVAERVPAAVPPLDAVRNRVLHRFLRERSAERFERTLRALRARFGAGSNPAESS